MSFLTADLEAREVAQAFVRLGTDPNEVSSSVTALHQMVLKDRSSAVDSFFRFLDVVIKEGRAVVRSGRTLDYYRQILKVCREHLTHYRDEPEVLAYVLGWSARLMRYYLAEGLPTERPRRSQSPRESISPAPSAGGERQSGRVKFFDTNKGFGFIIPDGGGKDVYVNRSQLGGGLTSLSSNQRVTYRIGQGRKGPRAEDVRLE